MRMRCMLRTCWTGLCSRLSVGQFGETFELDGVGWCEVHHGYLHYPTCSCSDIGPKKMDLD
jgi:hypothetical protein